MKPGDTLGPYRVLAVLGALRRRSGQADPPSFGVTAICTPNFGVVSP